MKRNIIGQKFNLLLVKSELKKNNKIYCECLCDCGNIKTIRKDSIINGTIKSCGCLKFKLKLADNQIKKAHQLYMVELLDVDTIIGQFNVDRKTLFKSFKKLKLSTKGRIFRKKRKIEDLTGQRFNNITVLQDNVRYANNKWDCKVQCDCGNIFNTSRYDIIRGHTKSCNKGRCNYGFKNLIDQQFGLLKVIELVKVEKHGYWKCECACGNITTIRADRLLSCKKDNCGCKTSERYSLAHLLPREEAIIRQLFASYKQGAKSRNLPFSLSIDEFKTIIFSNCNYCGITPSREKKARKTLAGNNHQLLYNGVDRVNSELGYFKNNCVPACTRCNIAKSDMTVEDFNKWIRNIVIFNMAKYK